MIWLYLGVSLVSLVGLVIVVLEWRRGVRDGLVGAFSTFFVALAVAASALVWLHMVDAARPREGVRSTQQVQAGGAESQGDPRLAGRTSVETGPGAAAGFHWRSIFTPDFIAGVLLTALFTVLAQVQTTLTIGRLHRSIEALRRYPR